ncbi:uncharacterized protein A4U43_C07F10980 [Asparagus officinalis]|uniref:Uncharacterized protein n=1 Tax=Asparagus officinalis TaxID=4686 RepID=A0A5P1EB22_ASPOF|nr:uncharacterized protein A4U43_C07F10980 [Asparagus officinalis]
MKRLRRGVAVGVERGRRRVYERRVFERRRRRRRRGSAAGEASGRRVGVVVVGTRGRRGGVGVKRAEGEERDLGRVRGKTRSEISCSDLREIWEKKEKKLRDLMREREEAASSSEQQWAIMTPSAEKSFKSSRTRKTKEEHFPSRRSRRGWWEVSRHKFFGGEESWRGRSRPDLIRRAEQQRGGADWASATWSRRRRLAGRGGAPLVEAASVDGVVGVGRRVTWQGLRLAVVGVVAEVSIAAGGVGRELRRLVGRAAWRLFQRARRWERRDEDFGRVGR